MYVKQQANVLLFQPGMAQNVSALQGIMILMENASNAHPIVNTMPQPNSASATLDFTGDPPVVIDAILLAGDASLLGLTDAQVVRVNSNFKDFKDSKLESVSVGTQEMAADFVMTCSQLFCEISYQPFF